MATGIEGPGSRTEWVDSPRHARALDLWRGGTVPGATFVDCASFVVMRELRSDGYLGFDRHFPAAGFAAVARQP
jgi:predicted nucleic acid-binding protein